MRVAVKFAYYGKKFHGYARQPQLITVEGSLITILKKLGYIKDPKTSVFRSASRTDKGVSALGNVIAFNTDDITNLLNRCNNELDNIVCYGLQQVDDDFYPRHAKQRIYSYYLQKNNFDLAAIKSTASLFEGIHDFSNFARIEPHRNPIRTIEKIQVNDSDEFFIIEFFAQTYLWHQIRRIISVIQKVAEKKIDQEQIKTALINPNKKVDYGIASANYLILSDVLYHFSFNISNNLKKKKDDFSEQLFNEIKYPFSKSANKTKQRN